MVRPNPLFVKVRMIGGILVCLIAFLLFRSLKQSSELSEDEFVGVYVQLSIANETFSSDSLKLKEEKKKILEQAGVTPKQIDNFVARYNQKPEKWARVWKKIVERLPAEFEGAEREQKF